MAENGTLDYAWESKHTMYKMLLKSIHGACEQPRVILMVIKKLKFTPNPQLSQNRKN